MIRPSELSVVVQGPVDQTRTPACLASVRRHLPGAELILSTWAGTDVLGLDYDQLVENDDPGAVPCTTDGRLSYNLNRQIVSTVNGLKATARPYVIKVRTDMEFTGTGFLDLFDRFPARASAWKMFEQRLVGCTIPSQSVRRRGLPLCPSDWFHFGLRNDVLTLWDVPLDHGHQIAQYFDTRPRPTPDRMRSFRYRYTPEQYVWLHCLRKFEPVDLEHLGDARPEMKRLTELTFANNLVLADEGRLGVWFHKYRHSASATCGYMTYDEWKVLYRTYCDPGYRGVSRSRYWVGHLFLIAQLLWFRAAGRVANTARALARRGGGG
jgi:hypothetical protein